MRYEYTITKEGGEAEIMKAMGWKKLFKSLLLKYPEFSGWCTYINKKGHVQTRGFNNGKETKKLWQYPHGEHENNNDSSNGNFAHFSHHKRS